MDIMSKKRRDNSTSQLWFDTDRNQYSLIQEIETTDNAKDKFYQKRSSETKVNRLGNAMPRFNLGISGMMSLRERKQRNLAQQSLQQNDEQKTQYYNPRNDKFFGYAQFPSPKHVEVTPEKVPYKQKQFVTRNQVESTGFKEINVVKEHVDQMASTYCQFLSGRKRLRNVSEKIQKSAYSKYRNSNSKVSEYHDHSQTNSPRTRNAIESRFRDKPIMSKFGGSFSERPQTSAQNTFTQLKKFYERSQRADSEQLSNVFTQSGTQLESGNQKTMTTINMRDQTFMNSTFTTNFKSPVQNQTIYGFQGMKQKHTNRVNPFLKESTISMSEERETNPRDIHQNAHFIVKTGKNHQEIMKIISDYEEELEQNQKLEMRDQERKTRVKAKGKYPTKVPMPQEQFSSDMKLMKYVNAKYFRFQEDYEERGKRLLEKTRQRKFKSQVEQLKQGAQRGVKEIK